jgi:acetyl/propionyl-CoA carboxylase alpha subunit
MRRALDELAIIGVATNQGFHRRLLDDAEFRAGEIDIQFLDRRADLVEPAPDDDELVRLAVTAALAEDERRRRRRPVAAEDGRGRDAWALQARLDALR